MKPPSLAFLPRKQERIKGDKRFVAALEKDSYDLATWLIQADWLLDQDQCARSDFVRTYIGSAVRLLELFDAQQTDVFFIRDTERSFTRERSYILRVTSTDNIHWCLVSSIILGDMCETSSARIRNRYTQRERFFVMSRVCSELDEELSRRG